jgi:uncharacterized membrane protein YhaH (DUF805 family)
MAEENKSAKWVITLTGGDWATVKYGVVEYLRKHPRLRAATAVSGLAWMVGWIAVTAGFKLQSSILPTASIFFVTPTLLWLAVVSGPDFQLAFGESKAPPKSQEPSVDSKGPIDPEGYGIEALNKSYKSADAYGRSSFRWALFALLAGIAMASGSVWFAVNGTANISPAHVFPFIWILSGALFLLCVILLVRAMFAFRRATAIHDKLFDFQKAITAMKFLERSKEVKALDPSTVIAGLLSSRKTDERQ